VIGLTLATIAKAVGGRTDRIDGDPLVTGSVEFDSRKIGPGDLFVAVPGERVDGHDFAAAAIERGAVAVLAAHEVGVPAVIVPRPETGGGSRALALAGDTDGSGAAVLTALGRLANHVVGQLPGLTVVGLTGSSGKTSTKDLIAALLAPLGPTVAPPGSFNNELGHPWTALRATEDTRHLVLELSARGPGHIAALCEIAPPRIGAVLNVGSAHLGEFGSKAQIAATKGELVEALPEDGVAVLNADDPLVATMAERTKARVVFVGESARAQVRAVDVTLDAAARARFTLVTPQGRAEVRLGVYGAHQVGNALTAAAIALELGATVEQVAAGLGGFTPVSAHRMAVTERPDGVTVVDDAYNANPESVRAALKTLAALARERNGRSWAVLGHMGELGDTDIAEHDQIGRLAVRLDISRLVVVGEDAAAMHRGANLEGSWGEESVLVPDVEAAVALLRAELGPGDVVLVKASNAVRLWRVAEQLLEDAR
jgi:UDP-N-acetylmuramoyl-tripeptide--D-alanyl-D-alanine ligase